MIVKMRALYLPAFFGAFSLLSAIAVAVGLQSNAAIRLGGAWFVVGLSCALFFALYLWAKRSQSERSLEWLLFVAFIAFSGLAVKFGGGTTAVISAALACATIVVIVARRRGYGPMLAQVGFICAIVASGVVVVSLMVFARRWEAVPVAGLEVVAIYGATSWKGLFDRVGVMLTAIISWVAAFGYTFVAPSNFLLNATASSALALLVFALAFILTNAVVVAPVPATSKPAHSGVWLIGLALLVFLVLGLNTDGTLSVWIPYHQSYFIGPAAMVRAGHWLLWDVPSQYGFASIIAIVLFFGKTTFDKLYFLTDVVVAIEAMMVFLLAWWSRRTTLGYIFAILLTASIFYSSQGQYYPFGATLYPQEGLRVIWPMACMFFGYLTYRWRDSPRRLRLATALGYLSWLIGCAWAMEVAVWSTLAWGSWVIAWSYLAWLRDGFATGLRRIIGLVTLGIVLIGALIGFVVTFYVTRLHHVPDIRSFFEFTFAYGGTNQFSVPVDVIGGMWVIVLALAAVASAVVYLATKRGSESLLATLPAWFGLWGFSIYFAEESYETHVGIIMPLIAMAAFITWCVSSEDEHAFEWMNLRLAFVPIFIILLTYNFGAISHLESIRIPWPLGSDIFSRTLPPISGELREIERRAKIRANDLVLYPSSPAWSKISTGQILPIERRANGNVTERFAWLPLAPTGMVNTMLTLSHDRQGTYIARALAVGPGGGWIITYLQRADCSRLFPGLRTTEMVSTEHYSAAYCSSNAGRARP